MPLQGMSGTTTVKRQVSTATSVERQISIASAPVTPEQTSKAGALLRQILSFSRSFHLSSPFSSNSDPIEVKIRSRPKPVIFNPIQFNVGVVVLGLQCGYKMIQTLNKGSYESYSARSLFI